MDLPQDIDIDQLSSLLQLRRAVADLERRKWQLSMNYAHVGPFLIPGRILRVESDTGIDFGWAIVLNVHRSKSRDPDNGAVLSDFVMVDILVRVAVENPDDFTETPLIDPAPLKLASFKPIDEYDILAAEEKLVEESSSVANTLRLPSKNRKRPAQNNGESRTPPTKIFKSSVPTAMATIASVPLDCLHEMSVVCLNFKNLPGVDPKNPTALVGKIAKLPPSLRLKFWEGIERAKAKLGGHLPLMNPVEDLGVKNTELKTCLEVSYW